MRYSNAGFALLGHLVEIVSEETLEAYLQMNVYSPLEMNETSFYIDKLSREKQAHCYTYAKKVRGRLSPGDGDGNLLPKGVSPKVGYNEHALYSYPTLSDGMVRTSVNQLANFMSAMMNGGRFKNTRLLMENSVKEMLPDEGHGLSWFRTGDYWHHDGGDPGCSTELIFNPDRGIGILIFANADVELKKVKALLLAEAEKKTQQEMS